MAPALPAILRVIIDSGVPPSGNGDEARSFAQNVASGALCLLLWFGVVAGHAFFP